MPYKLMYVPRWYNADDEDCYDDYEPFDNLEDALAFIKDCEEDGEEE